MKLASLGFAALLFTAPAIACAESIERSPAMADYVTKLKPFVLAQFLAAAASACGWRSQEWARTIGTGVLLLEIKEASRLYLSEGQKDAVAEELRRVAMPPREAWNCHFRERQATLESLDRLEYLITGGYH